MSFSAGTISEVSATSTSAILSSTAASGGTGPYTYQWYMSTTSGFTPGAGNLVAGATNLSNQSFSGLSPSTTYYFVIAADDTGNGNAIADSGQFSLTTPAATIPLTTVVLSKTELVKLEEALGSKSAGDQFIASIYNRTAPSASVVKILGVALTENVINKSSIESSLQEILAAILSGATLSLKAQRRFAEMLGDVKLALKIINMIQVVQTPKLVL
jgi:hypothetical protein